ncbi:MAG: ATP-binding protein [Desulfuromonadales bacterium]|nr:ATP-binding protein [Desulfuromonadales bacterium]
MKPSKNINYATELFELLYKGNNAIEGNVSLNKRLHLLMNAITQKAPFVFERAMLLLVNNHTSCLHGMFGIACSQEKKLASTSKIQSKEFDLSEQEIEDQYNSRLSRDIRKCKLEMKPNKNASFRAIQEKQILHIQNISKEKNIDHAFLKRFGIQEFVVAPIQGREQILGVVIADNPASQKKISEYDIDFLQMITSHTGTVIEDSLLHNRLAITTGQLQEAREQILHDTRLTAIGEMAASIAHELKGPMVSIGGFARILAKKLTLATKESQYLSTIIEETGRLENMLSDILAYSKKTTICYEECKIEKIIESSLNILQPIFKKSRINVLLIPPKKPIKFYGDCHQIKQVFINLFSNAHEAMENGGTLNITIGQDKVDKRKVLYVKVTDNGKGIPSDVLEKIFIPFYTTKKSGTGLGLTISNQIISNHKGEIRVSNLPDRGAEVTVILPCI